MAGGHEGPTRYTGVLDVRLFDRLERLPRVLQSLQALAPGESLLVITANPPDRLTAFLRQEFDAPLTITPVRSGPPVWQTCLQRE